MDLTKRLYKQKINLEEMSDEQLLELIESVETPDGSFDSDDSVADPTYVYNIETDILPEDAEQAIAECVHNMGVARTTDEFLEANFSLNLSTMDIPAANSTFVEDVPVVETVATQEPSTSYATTKKASFKCKRARSPLPTAEATGLSVQPNQIRLFYHFVDMASTNAFILYKRLHAEKTNDSNNVTDEELLLQLIDFRNEITAGLVSIKKNRSVGRPSIAQNLNERLSPQPSISGVRKRAVYQVPDVRFDGVDHFPVWVDRKAKKRCKHCKKSDTQVVCSKCDLHLCGQIDKNCFWDYHHRK